MTPCSLIPILCIKSLLSNHKKYLVWQSIDGNFWDYEKDFIEVYLEKYHEKVDSSDLRDAQTDNFVLKKENLNKELKRGTSKSQRWINIDHIDWKSWLENNYKHKDVFVWSSNHPNEHGINLWYEMVLSKELSKII